MFRSLTRRTWACIVLALLVGISGLYRAHILEQKYDALMSTTLLDKHGKVLIIAKSSVEEFAYAGPLDTEAEELVLDQEDQWYYYHLGANPVRIAIALYNFYVHGIPGSGSSIPQQLAKILTKNESRRSLLNKCTELIDAFILSIFFSKHTTLTMYSNSVYMGNSVRGLHTASLTYYGKPLHELTRMERKTLIQTIPSPTHRNPAARKLTKISRPYLPALQPELLPLLEKCSQGTPKNTGVNGCRITIDKKLQDTSRAFLRTKVEQLSFAGVTSGVVIIVDTRTNSVLASVGTPYPTSTVAGASIDMSRETRPIGSTIKPLIFAEAFKKGLRPYSIIEDREYAFTTESGSKIYPKNYAGSYSGDVTVHYALSNSLNVPAVKALEFVGLPRMYALLQGELGLAPVSPLESYSYGIALGGLEASPLMLAQMLSVFPREGLYSPLKFFNESETKTVRILPPEETRLVTSILSDKHSRADQFGATTLTLPFDNYAVKTGTSRDYHDSWTIGYTPYILVLTWLGNPENKPLRAISGGIGAGSLWKDIMLLLHSKDYSLAHLSEQSVEKAFSKEGLAPHPRDGITTYTLARDTTPAPDIRDSSLILFPHDGDVFTIGSTIPIHTRAPAEIYINNKFQSSSLNFTPSTAGTYTLRATRADGTSEELKIDFK